MKYDVDSIKENNPLLTVIGQDIELKKSGNEYQACCPFHTEKTPSFTVVPDKGFAHCFGCGKHISDAIDWIMEYHGVTFPTACDILGGQKEAPEFKTRKRRINKIEKDIYAEITPIIPVPDSAPLIAPGKKTPEIFNPKRSDDPDKRTTTYKPSMVSEYHNQNGALIGYVLRIDFGDGAKITPSVMWCKLPDGSEGWSHRPFPEPRPLYNMPSLYRSPDAPVLIVEGEKSADAAGRIMKQYVVVTWPGGSKAIKKVDWAPLRGRKVVIWGDADKTGEEAAIEIAAKRLDAGTEEIKIIAWDKEMPKGWDAADAEAEGWTKKEVLAWAKERVSLWPPKEDGPPVDEYDGPPLDEQYRDQQPPEPSDEPTEHFRALGYDKNTFYYLPDKTQQVIELSPGMHTENNLLILAPGFFWEEQFPAKGDFKFNIKHAYEALINKCIKNGIFDGHELLRGRGAWLDEGRVVLHMGDKLITDEGEIMPKNFKSKYIYEASRKLNIPVSERASTPEAHKLVEICEKLTWENSLSASLLAGWCVIAPVCGILSWRPHIWVTGQSGSGKTTVIKDIIEKVVGPIVLIVEGNTSEAGIRQQIQQDARPVIFDEAETEDKSSALRMKSILDLARVASSGGRILKGDTSGQGTSYSIRSAFCFSSINTSLHHYADESRVSKLILKPDKGNGTDKESRFKPLHHEMLSTFTEEYSGKMLARSLANINTLMKNAKTFVEAAARILSSRRIADQIGVMLAGTYLCYSTKEISLQQAVEWIGRHNWADHTAISNKKDEERLLDRIATHRLRLNIKHGSVDATIGELILVGSGRSVEDLVKKEEAERELRRQGIMVTYDSVWIANKSDPMSKILKHTPWSSEWGRPLRDIDGAEAWENTYFAPGIKSRSTKLPIELFQE